MDPFPPDSIEFADHEAREALRNAERWIEEAGMRRRAPSGEIPRNMQNDCHALRIAALRVAEAQIIIES